MDRQLLNRATDGTDAPTPGYMYIDIAKNASSSPMACQEIATFLTRKLANKQNANIKWKCLKVITKTAETVGRGQFKRAVAQDQSAVASIRLATNFRGPPDPVRGDEPYNRVRLAAKECLDVIYSDTPTQTDQSPYNTGGGGGMSNTYGAPPHQQSSYGGGGGGGGGMPPLGGRRMEGIGNPMFSDPRLEPQPKPNLEAIIKDVGESFVGMIKDPLARNADVRISNARGQMPRPGGMPGYAGPGAYGRPPPGRSELAHATGGQWTMASNRGPDAVGASNDSYYKSREQQANSAFSWANKDGHGPGGGVGGSWASASPGVAAQARQPSYAEQHSSTPSITVNSVPGSNSVTRGSGGTAVSDGSYEKSLIMELCPPGGMKPVPPPDKLLNFAKAIPNLNPDLICPVLLDCLEDGHPWIMRAKALCVMETCIQAGQRSDNTNPYANFLYTCREEIEPLADHPRTAIKDPARRVLASLGIKLSSQPAAAPPAAAPPAPPAPVNLLDFDDDTPGPSPPAPPPSAPPPPPASSSSDQGGPSLFGGMQVKGGSVPAASAAPPVAPPPAPTSGNLLDGLTINEPPAAAAAPQPAQVTNMFDTMTIKSKESEEEKKKGSDDDDLAAVAMSGSAFGFINEDPSKNAGAAPAAAAPATKASFDPLLNFSPNSARQMMQLSPEQMQAMAYQQMLMQQQMQQMQQMQMAMALQGGVMPMPRGVMPGMMPGMPNQRVGVMGPHPGKTSSGFSFLDNPTKKEDHTFDFVRDAMKTEKTHK